MTKLVIGLEMHAEMKSTTKVFSPSSNVYNKMANVNINEIDLAFPGSVSYTHLTLPTT